ncbi:hypothetical protein PoB_001515900 [Plakobranchus ocellatus]|uniref:Uncharacterized protein n=1 Tax=Plakobranchus ocellatus TaxID=259542 RepID=A0AAV3Z2P3_9GAST|nr:hypothetical protein PoB_001515900 [Plakobranchus ocellatus]
MLGYNMEGAGSDSSSGQWIFHAVPQYSSSTNWDTLLAKKIMDGLKDAHNGNQGQEEETGADQKQNGWMTSGEQQVHNGRGRHKIGVNGRHLQSATFYSGWTKPPSNQVT